jgi:HD-GYP domain-containing protein (c-di-GMP phosphodiesterase class II)
LNEAGLKAYVAALSALSLALIASWVYSFGFEYELPYLLGAAIFGALLVLAELFPLRVNEHSEISAIDVLLISSVVTMGPLWAALCALPCAFVVGRKDLLRTAYEASRNTTEIFAAGLVLSSVAPPLISSGMTTSMTPAPLVYATFAAAATLVLVNGALDAGLLRVKYGQPFGKTFQELGAPYLVSDALNILTAGLAVLALLVYGPMAAVILVAGSVGSQALVLFARERGRRSRELEAEVNSLRRALTESGIAFGTTVMEALGRKDGRAHRHAAATSVYAADLAREFRLDESRAELLRMAGLLADIGMISLPEEVLLSSGEPNSLAQGLIAGHPVHGERALARVGGFEEVAQWVRWHHERVDGRGYPDKLRDSWIPLEAKILAVAQAYAAMVLDGPRRPGVKPAQARGLLVAGIDNAFDATVVRAFLRVLDTETEGYRMADDHRFVFPQARFVSDTPEAAGS